MSALLYFSDVCTLQVQHIRCKVIHFLQMWARYRLSKLSGQHSAHWSPPTWGHLQFIDRRKGDKQFYSRLQQEKISSLAMLTTGACRGKHGDSIDSWDSNDWCFSEARRRETEGAPSVRAFPHLILHVSKLDVMLLIFLFSSRYDFLPWLPFIFTVQYASHTYQRKTGNSS